MSAMLHHAGSHLDHTPAGDVVAGTPTLLSVATTYPKALVGVPANDIEAGRLGSMTIGGVYKVPNSGIVVTPGVAVGYDGTAGNAVAGGGGDFDLGIATQAAAEENGMVERHAAETDRNTAGAEV